MIKTAIYALVGLSPLLFLTKVILGVNIPWLVVLAPWAVLVIVTTVGSIIYPFIKNWGKE